MDSYLASNSSMLFCSDLSPIRYFEETHLRSGALNCSLLQVPFSPESSCHSPLYAFLFGRIHITMASTTGNFLVSTNPVSPTIEVENPDPNPTLQSFRRAKEACEARLQEEALAAEAAVAARAADRAPSDAEGEKEGEKANIERQSEAEWEQARSAASPPHLSDPAISPTVTPAGGESPTRRLVDFRDPFQPESRSRKGRRRISDGEGSSHGRSVSFSCAPECMPASAEDNSEGDGAVPSDRRRSSISSFLRRLSFSNFRKGFTWSPISPFQRTSRSGSGDRCRSGSAPAVTPRPFTPSNLALQKVIDKNVQSNSIAVGGVGHMDGDEARFWQAPDRRMSRFEAHCASAAGTVSDTAIEDHHCVCSSLFQSTSDTAEATRNNSQQSSITRKGRKQGEEAGKDEGGSKVQTTCKSMCKTREDEKSNMAACAQIFLKKGLRRRSTTNERTPESLFSHSTTNAFPSSSSSSSCCCCCCHTPPSTQATLLTCPFPCAAKRHTEKRSKQIPA